MSDEERSKVVQAFNLLVKPQIELAIKTHGVDFAVKMLRDAAVAAGLDPQGFDIYPVGRS